MKTIPGRGPLPCPILIVGERPGIEEYRAGYPFVGPAGDELWSRLWDVCGLQRDDVYVTNLVKSFSPKPPTAAEIARDRPFLMGELARCRPSYIITVGYHAARAFLPQFVGIAGDYFHGLVFRVTYGALRPREALCCPVVHASAALRQPALYQNQLTKDLRMARRMLDGKAEPRPPSVRPPVFRVGLASIAQDDPIVGLDTEGSLHYPWPMECVTLSGHGAHAALINGLDHLALMTAARSLEDADRIVIHHATHDLKTLAMLDATFINAIPLDKLDDTMEMAYLLDEPQALKVLSARLLGWRMDEYTDLTDPLDNARVRAVLEQCYATQTAALQRQSDYPRHRRGAHARGEDAGDGQRYDGKLRAPRPGQSGHPPSQGQGAAEDGDHFPRRALTSLKKILTTEGEKTLRQRWEGSVFAPTVPLPPPVTWADLPPTVREPYAMTDALAHRGVRRRLWPRIVKQGLERVYALDMSVIPFLVRNEIVGLACDEKMLRRLSLDFAADYDRLCRKINALAGYEVNPVSGPQVSDCLFENLGVRPTRLTKKGDHFTTADKYLKARRREHDIIPLMLEARQIGKYIGTYTDKLPSMLVDGRYHPEWKYTRTKTGRLAEVVILLIPKHTARGKQIRNAFHATDGHALVSVDLSQIEMRVMADESKDAVLLEFFRSGKDIHAQTAERLLGAPKGKENQDESLHRLPAKTINFGIINGMTEYGMLDQLHEGGQLQWDLEQVQELLRDWFRLHKGVKAWWDQQIAKGKKLGYVESRFGRRSYLAGLHSTSPQVVAEAERQCLMPIQSGADDISKLWNARIWNEIIRPRQLRGERYCEPWVRVHDDTTLEVDARIQKGVMMEMLACVPDTLCVPTLAEGKRGERWGDLH